MFITLTYPSTYLNSFIGNLNNMKIYIVLTNYSIEYNDEHNTTLVDEEETNKNYYMVLHKEIAYECRKVQFTFEIFKGVTYKYIKANNKFFLEYKKPTIYL